jgi:hypothetical protein
MRTFVLLFLGGIQMLLTIIPYKIRDLNPPNNLPNQTDEKES